MPNTKARVVGSGYSVFSYRGKPIAFLEGIEDSGQRAFSDLGQPYQFIHPLGATHPVEIATSRVLSGGTLQLTIRELWNEPVWHQLAGLAQTYNIVDIYRVLARDPEYVTCQTIIKPPGTENNPSAWRGKTYQNCLSGDTRFLTAEGTKTLAETVGTTQMVLSSRGHWTPASIESFGVQKLLKVTLSRQGTEKVVYATAGHRWFKEGRRPQKSYAKELTTSQLKPGDVLVSTYKVNETAHITPSAVGIQAGIVFGDGHIEGKARNVSGVTLCGDKDAQLLKWFPNSPTRAAGDNVVVTGLPGFFKSPPPFSEGLTYLYGWLAGYFAADGTVDSKGSASISSAKRENLELVQDVCHKLGIRTHGIKTERRVGIGQTEPSELHKIVIHVPSLTEEFFLIDEHRERASGRLDRDSAKSMASWKVVSVEETDREEEVFCAVVPDGQAFVLEDNLLTGNCVVVDINDGDTISVGALAVTKGITVAYTHTTPINPR